MRDPLSDIVVVSGLPRSGTSLMMKMLAAGGLPLLTDGLRVPDEDNPEGYFEFELVKKLNIGEQAWLAEAGGKAVKVISALLKSLPATYTYKVVLMKRRMNEILASQRRMLIRRGEPEDAIADERMGALLAKHLQQVEDWLAVQPNLSLLIVDYNALVADPHSHAERVNAFLDGGLDVTAMRAAVNPQLYRNRSTP